MPAVGIGISPMFSRGGLNTYVSDFRTRVYAEGGTLTSIELGYLNTFANSVDLSEFDRLWIHGLSNQIAARVSLVNALTVDLITEVNAPTWTANTGYTGNGTTMYLNTNYNASVDSSMFTQNSACLGVYFRNNINDTGDAIGAQDVTNKFRLITRLGDLVYYAVNESIGAATSSAANLNGDGLFCAFRNNATHSSIYRNGVQVSQTAVNSNGLPNVDCYILALNLNGSTPSLSTNQISLSFLSSGNVVQSDFYTAVQTLGTSIGWAV